MRLYKFLILITGVMSTIALISAYALSDNVQYVFWSNALIGIFGSALLTFISSLVGYFNERRVCMEAFFTETLQYLNELFKYQTDLELEEKLRFFVSLADYNTINWDAQFGRMDFWDKRIYKYIYEKIYSPIQKIIKLIRLHSWHFRMHLNGTAKNAVVMDCFVKEIEKELFTYKTELIDSCEITYGNNTLYDDLTGELSGQYREILYNPIKSCFKMRKKD